MNKNLAVSKIISYFAMELEHNFTPIYDKSPRRAYHKNCWRVILL